MSLKTGLLKITSLSLLSISMIFLVLGIIAGDVEFFFFIIIPVIRLTGIIGAISFIFFLGGMTMFFLYLWTRSSDSLGLGKESSEGSGEIRRTRHRIDDKQWGGIVFIGPVPIVIGDKRTRSRFPRWWVLLLVGIGLTLVLYIGLTLLLSLLKNG
ncbi:MAG: DUF131 domain-containing protein [Thermoplasmatota archaeon]